MPKKHSAALLSTTVDFIGSAHVFTSALTDVMERKLIEDVSEGALSFDQIKVLQLLAKADRHNVTEVAAFMRISNAAASKAIDKLVRMRLIGRAEGKMDRRATHLRLTDTGARLLNNYNTARLKAIGKIMEGISVEEVRTLCRTLDLLSASIVSHILGSNDICLQCGIHLRERCVLHDGTGGSCSYRRLRGREKG